MVERLEDDGVSWAVVRDVIFIYREEDGVTIEIDTKNWNAINTWIQARIKKEK